MPELPEVETIKEGLNKVLIGKRFTDIQVLDKKIFQAGKEKILNKKILSLDRRAKLIIFNFEGDLNMVVHLKMTGQFIYQDKEKRLAGGHQSEELYADVPNKHTRVIFKISGGSMLYYNDLIRYSWIKILDDKELQNLSEKEFGEEPLSKTFTFGHLKSLIQASKKSNIKRILTDQKKIAGIGNIYADEILYNARINPRRSADSLKDVEIKKIYNSIGKILRLGIKNRGSSIKNYVDYKGIKGKMQDYFKVYGKNGNKCECGGKVEKIRLNGRGTHFCPKCQK